MTSLKSLDLSHNKLEDISSDNETFRLPKNITEIYLSNNILNTLPWGHFENASNLKLIDISYNNFDSFANVLTKIMYNDGKIDFIGELCTLQLIKKYVNIL